MRYSSVLFSALVATAITGAAQAATVNETQTQILTSSGQDFTFTFGGLAASDGTGGTLVISSGINQANPGVFDGLDLDQSTEFFSLDIDGTSFGNFNCTGSGGHTAILGASGGVDCDFSLPITLSGTQLDSFLADGSITASLNFSDDVTFFSSELDEVIVSLSYEESVAPVPLPASGLLLIGAVGALAARRRQKS